MSNRRKSREKPLDARFTVTVPGARVPGRPFPPGAHPGSDVLTVVWPDVRIPAGLHGAALETWLKDIPPGAVEVRSEDVTRDEFTRRMARSDVVSQVNADPRNRVIGLVEPAAVAQWTASRDR